MRETLRQTTIRDANGQASETAVISWIASRGTMSFRATGGDDDVMAFHRVQVIQPANLESLQVTVTPPAYSQRSQEVLSQGVGHVQGLIGTKVEASVRSDKPLASALLQIANQPAVPLAVSADGHEFTASFEISSEGPGSYSFELTDTDGFADRDPVRYELRGIADGVPEVTIELPASDVYLTADAELPISVLAKDDLGLRAVRLNYQIGDDETTHSIPLFQQAPIPSHNVESTPGENGVEPTSMGPQQHSASYLWKMAELHLEPGSRLVLRAEATDDYDLGPPHVGVSVPRTITIVSSEEKKKELASRVSDLLDDLKQATLLQQRARQQTQELQTQLENVGELRSQDFDQLQRTELDQRQTASRLTHPTDGVETRSRKLLEEFRGNRVQDEGTEQRLERLSNELERLQREELPAAERALTQAQKTAESNFKSSEPQSSPTKSSSPTASGATESKTSEPQGAGSKTSETDSQNAINKKAGTPENDDPQPPQQQPDPDGAPQTDLPAQVEQSDAGQPDIAKPTADETTPDRPGSASQSRPKPTRPNSTPTEKSLAEAAENQEQTLDTLRELQESLSDWRDRREVSKDLSSVITEQEAVQKEAAEMAQNTLTKSAAELTKQEKAELNKLAARQLKVADQLEQFKKQLEQTANSLQKNDAEAAERMGEAQQKLNEQETTSKLQEAAEDISENKLGAATQAQQAALDELRDLERMMKRQPTDDTEQFVKQTEEAQQEFQQIRQEQQQLADQVEELAKQSESPEKQEQLKGLLEKQEDLTERMAKAERKLERLRLHGPAEASHRARQRLTEMAKDMQEAEDGEEMQQAMEEALDDLEQVERELVLEKRIAQERLAFEQLEKIEDELKSLRSRQEAVVAETLRLEEAKAERGSLSRGQLKSLKELTETERSLQQVAEQLQHQMAAAEVFSLVLKRLGRSLQNAADQLSQQETGLPTQTFEKDAIRKIDSLLAVLKQEQKKQEQEKPPAEKPEELGQEPQEREEKPEEAQPPGDTIPQLAQLKLLKALQEEYLERTELLETFRDKDGNLPEKMQAEQDELTREQSELADFARNLIAKFLQQQPERPEPDQMKSKAADQPGEADPNKIDP